MPVIFSYSDEGNYLKVDYIGRQTDEGILSAWKQFFDTVGEVRGVNVMTVLTDSDFSDVSMEALNQLNEMARAFHDKHQIQSIKVANVSSEKLAFGMARVYEGIATGSIELIRTFRSEEEALAWLTEPEDSELKTTP